MRGSGEKMKNRERLERKKKVESDRFRERERLKEASNRTHSNTQQTLTT